MTQEIKGNLKVLREIQSSWFKFRSGNQAEFLNIQVDPTQVAIDAPKGSLALREQTQAEVYVKLDDGESTNWRKLSDLTVFPTVNGAESSSGSQNLLSFVVETNTFYRFEENGSAYTPNSEQVLSTSDGGNTRWIAVAGFKAISERFQKYAQTVKACGFTLSGSDNESTLSFDGTSRIFSLTPTTEEVIWRQDDLFSITETINVTLDNSSGRHYIYFGKDENDDGEVQLRSTTDFTEAQRKREALVASVYLDTASNKYLLKDERHTASIPADSRLLEHINHGSYIKPSTGVISGTVGDGSDNAHAQISVTDSTLVDEDIRHVIEGNHELASIPVVYKSGTNIVWDSATNFVFKVDGGQAQINVSNAQVAVNNGEFFCSHIFAIGDDLVAIQGRSSYPSVDDAFAEAYLEVQNIFTDMSEFLEDASILGTVVFEANTSFAANARLSKNWMNLTSISWVDDRLNNTNQGRIQTTINSIGGSTSGDSSIKALRKTSSNTTISLFSDYVVWCDTSSNNISVTLPDATTSDTGKTVIIKKTSTDNTVSVTSNQNIEGVSDNYELLAGNRGSITLQTDGNEWFII